jgi:hypothetical protein
VDLVDRFLEETLVVHAAVLREDAFICPDDIGVHAGRGVKMPRPEKSDGNTRSRFQNPSGRIPG